MNSRLLTFILIVLDWLSALVAWSLFYYLRKANIENVEFTVNNTFYMGIALFPIAWLLLYLLQGTYQDARRLHRLKILGITFSATLMGVIGIFFLFLLDDEINRYEQYYYSVLLLFGVHFTITFVPRFVLVSYIVKQIHNRKSGFKTLIVGGSDKAVDIFEEINGLPIGTGHQFVGFINLNGVDKLLSDDLPYLGHIDQVESVLREHEFLRGYYCFRKAVQKLT